MRMKRAREAKSVRHNSVSENLSSNIPLGFDPLLPPAEYFFKVFCKRYIFDLSSREVDVPFLF